MSMAKTYEELLELQDLYQLHRHFDGSAENMPLPEEIEAVPVSGGRDLWTEAVMAVSAGSRENMQKIQAEILHADLTSDEKIWWESVFGIAMHAPPEVLEKAARGQKEMPPVLSTESVSAASRLLAEKAAKEERQRRWEAEQKEKERLRKLRQEAARREEEKRLAEQNLQAHVRSQENRR